MEPQAFPTHEFRISALQAEAILTSLTPLFQDKTVDVTLSSSEDVVTLIAHYHDMPPEAIEQHIDQVEQKIRARLTEAIFPGDNGKLQKRIGEFLEQQQLTLATIESLTGGLIASALTDMHESSAHFLGGIVAYSSLLKERMGVPHATLERYGVISAETARAMASSVRRALEVEIGLGITGVAGPDEQEGQPVGTVHIAISGPYGDRTCLGSDQCAGPNREENKQAATLSALHFLKTYLETQGAGS